MDLLKEMEELNSELKVYHGGLGGSPQKAAERPKPMKILKDFIKEHELRIFDFFKTLDKDKSMSISIAEFVKGLKGQGDIYNSFNFKYQPHKMVKHTRKIRLQITDELFECVWSFCGVGA